MGWDSWIRSADDQSLVLCVCVYVDTLDDSAIPLRSIDEFGMEEINSVIVVEYDYNGGGDFVKPLNPLKGTCRGTGTIYLKRLNLIGMVAI